LEERPRCKPGSRHLDKTSLQPLPLPLIPLLTAVTTPRVLVALSHPLETTQLLAVIFHAPRGFGLFTAKPGFPKTSFPHYSYRAPAPEPSLSLFQLRPHRAKWNTLRRSFASLFLPSFCFPRNGSSRTPATRRGADSSVGLSPSTCSQLRFPRPGPNTHASSLPPCWLFSWFCREAASG